MSPKNDFAFRLLFGDTNNSDLLISLLNAILTEQITHVTIMDPHLLRESFEDKEGILDVRAVTNTNVQIDREIQLVDYTSLPKRILFSWSKMFLSQISSGDPYSRLRKTISIVILDYERTKIDDLHSCYQIYDEKNGAALTDVLEIHIPELPKLHKRKSELPINHSSNGWGLSMQIAWRNLQ